MHVSNVSRHVCGIISSAWVTQRRRPQFAMQSQRLVGVQVHSAWLMRTRQQL
jgi:hypothetical protein